MNQNNVVHTTYVLPGKHDIFLMDVQHTLLHLRSSSSVSLAQILQARKSCGEFYAESEVFYFLHRFLDILEDQHNAGVYHSNISADCIKLVFRDSQELNYQLDKLCYFAYDADTQTLAERPNKEFPPYINRLILNNIQGTSGQQTLFASRQLELMIMRSQLPHLHTLDAQDTRTQKSGQLQQARDNPRGGNISGLEEKEEEEDEKEPDGGAEVKEMYARLEELDRVASGAGGRVNRFSGDVVAEESPSSSHEESSGRGGDEADGSDRQVRREFAVKRPTLLLLDFIGYIYVLVSIMVLRPINSYKQYQAVQRFIRGRYQSIFEVVDLAVGSFFTRIPSIKHLREIMQNFQAQPPREKRFYIQLMAAAEQAAPPQAAQTQAGPLLEELPRADKAAAYWVRAKQRAYFVLNAHARSLCMLRDLARLCASGGGGVCSSRAGGWEWSIGQLCGEQTDLELRFEQSHCLIKLGQYNECADRLNEISKFALSGRDQILLIRVNYYQSLCAYFQQQFALALHYLRTAAEMMQIYKICDGRSVFAVQLLRGLIHQDSGQPAESVKVFQEVINVHLSKLDSDQRATLYYFQGLNHQSQNEPQAALSCFLSAYGQNERFRFILLLFGHLAALCDFTCDAAQFIYYAQTAAQIVLQYATKNENTSMLCLFINEFGWLLALEKYGFFEQVSKDLLDIVHISITNNLGAVRPDRSFAHLALGKLYYYFGQMEAAAQQFRSSCLHSQQVNVFYCQCFEWIAHIERYERRRQDLADAFYRKSLDLYEDLRKISPLLEAECSRRKLLIWLELGNHEELDRFIRAQIQLRQFSGQIEQEACELRLLGDMNRVVSSEPGRRDTFTHAIQQYHSVLGSNTHADIALYLRIVVFCIQARQTSVALGILEDALARFDALVAEERLPETQLYDLIAMYCCLQIQLGAEQVRALPSFERMLAILLELEKRGSRVEHTTWQIIVCIDMISKIYTDLGRYAAAIRSFTAELRYQRELAMLRQTRLGSINFNLASLYLQIGSFSRAESVLREAYLEFQDGSGRHQLQSAICELKLFEIELERSTIFQLQQGFQQLQPVFQRVLAQGGSPAKPVGRDKGAPSKAREQQLLEAFRLRVLAKYYLRMEDHRQAFVVARKSIRAYETLFGAEDHACTDAAIILCQILLESKQFPKLEKQLSRLGGNARLNHQQRADLQKIQAKHFIQLKNYGEALKRIEESRSCLRAVLENDATQTHKSMAELALLQGQALYGLNPGDKASVNKWLDSAQAIYESVYAGKHENIALIYIEKAKLTYHRNEYYRMLRVLTHLNESQTVHSFSVLEVQQLILSLQQKKSPLKKILAGTL